jgi:uncharacterized RDD family membrane protein YckC
MKNDKQLIWGAALILVIYPFLFLIFLIYGTLIEHSQFKVYKQITGYLFESGSSFNFIPNIIFLFRSLIFPIFILPILSIIGLIRFKNYNKIHLLFFLLLFMLMWDLLHLFNYVLFLKIRLERMKEYSTFDIIYLVYEICFKILFFVIGFLSCFFLTQKKYLSNSIKGFNVEISLSKGTRLIHFLIDYIISINFTLSTFASTQMFFKENRFSLDGSYNEPFMNPDLLSFILSFTTFLLYFILSEGIFQTTLGKIVTKSIVVNADGNKIGFGKAIGRTLCRLIPLEPLSLLFGEKALHDSITETYVVKSEYIE